MSSLREIQNRIEQIAGEYETKKEFAATVGIPRETLTHLLSDKANPRWNTLETIARGSGRTVEWLLTGRDEQEFDYGNILHIPIIGHDCSVGVDGKILGEFGPAEPGCFALFLAVGDAMAPTIGAGDTVLIDRRRRDLQEGIYVVRLSSRAVIRRLTVVTRGIKLSVDNPAARVSEEMVSPQTLDIIGRAVWVGRKLA
ncbi:MAG: XRE family transcriptional regulator [bacterium]